MTTPTHLEQALERLAAKDALIAELRADLDTARRETVATKEWGEGYQNALSLYFAKMGLNEPWSLDARMAHVTKICGAWTALTRICEVIGAPSPVSPNDVVGEVTTLFGACQHAESRAKQAEEEIKAINLALLDAGAPRAYALDKGERPIPDADRVRILGDRVRGEHRERLRAEDDATAKGLLLGDAHLALDDRGAPRHADGITLTPAARIRAIPH